MLYTLITRDLNIYALKPVNYGYTGAFVPIIYSHFVFRAYRCLIIKNNW